MRVACVHIPHLYVQVEYLKSPALEGRTVVIVAMPEERGFVLDCSEELLQRGVKPSMPVKDIYPLLCSDTIPILARRIDYKLLQEEILSAIAGIALRIEPGEAGTFFIDISRLPGMYRSEEKLAYTLASLIVDRFHLKAHAGVGNSRFLAFEAALCSQEDVLVVPPGREKQFLAPLSIERLPMAGDILERLHLLGIHTLGQVSAFKLSTLISQFGTTGRVLWQLANGIEEQDRIPCAFTVNDIDQERVCDNPVYSKGQIRTALLDLLQGLCNELEDLRKACRTLHIVFDLENKTFLERQFVFHKATACKEEMLRRVMAGIEHLELTSPIRIMSVRASSLEPYAGKQEGLFRTQPRLSKEIRNINGFLKTKYGSMPVVRAVKNNSNSLLPDEQFIFVEP
jgi:DNA polymerase-4